MATIFDVARQANVSITTVSHVFSGKRLIAPATRERVLQAARELHYVPSRTGQALALGRNFTVAILLPNPLQYCLVNPAFMELLLTITEESSSAGYSALVFGITPGQVPNELRKVVEQRNIDGVLWIDPATDDDELCTFLCDRGIPLVIGGTPPLSEGIVHVRNDRSDVARLAVDHLRRLGHRGIGLVPGPRNLMVASDYVAAFQQVTTTHGLHLHTAYTNGWTIQDGRLALQALPAADGGTTGIVALNEAMAVGLIQAAQDQGRPVPESLSVVSLGNTHLAEHFSPGITAIDLASRRIGQTLAAAMFRLIEDPRAPQASFIVPVRLVVRRSTGGIGRPTPVPGVVPAA